MNVDIAFTSAVSDFWPQWHEHKSKRETSQSRQKKNVWKSRKKLLFLSMGETVGQGETLIEIPQGSKEEREIIKGEDKADL